MANRNRNMITFSGKINKLSLRLLVQIERDAAMDEASRYRLRVVTNLRFRAEREI